jgi:hypothetical protein
MDREVYDADSIGAKLTVVATVSFAGDARLIAVKTAIPFIEKEIKNVLDNVGMDSSVSVSVNFNV